MNTNPIILGDFAELDAQLASGRITRDQYQQIFAKSRKHGLKGDIYPFAVGGSDAAVILGLSPWRSPLRLYYEKTGLSKESESKDKEWIFFMGHVFEDPVREIFAKMSGLKTEPCTLQVSNPQYPHCVANIDGIVWENGKPGIYEGKTTHPWTDTKKHFVEDVVPIYYETQVQFYLEMWNLDFAYICCAWGLDRKDIKYKRIDRNKDFGCMICQACEDFAINAMNGKRPSNAIVQNTAVLGRDAEILYGKADSSLPPVKLPKTFGPSFRRLDQLSEEEDAIKKALEPYEKQIAKIKEQMKEGESKLKRIEKERTEILRIFPDTIKNATTGKYTEDGETWIVHYDPSNGYSLDAEVKQYWKENYPESFDAVTQYKPNYTRRLRYEKIENQH